MKRFFLGSNFVENLKLNNIMKAVYCTKYGGPEVLKIKEIEKPIVKKGEVLVKVVAASVTTAETMMRGGTPRYARLFFGLSKPKNPLVGTGFSGVVVELGGAIQNYQIGDEVYGETGLSFGSNAEFISISEKEIIAKKPNTISFEEAAPVCDGALTSLNFLRDVANIKKDQKVLIIGASGSLGTSAIQMAKNYGALVTGICSSSNVNLVNSLGADKVIDYTQVDFRKNGEKYDVIYDTLGVSSYSKCKKSLTSNGQYLSPVLSLGLLWNVIISNFLKKKAKFSATGLRPANELQVMLEELSVLFESKQLKTVIDKEFLLDEIREAHSYVDSGRKKGNIVLKIG